MESAPNVETLFDRIRRTVSEDPGEAPTWREGAFLGALALLGVLCVLLFTGVIGGRFPPPVAGVTEMTRAAIPQMSGRFLGTLRARAAALSDPTALEALGPPTARGGATVQRVAYRVEGERVVGLLGLPAGDAPAAGVVLCHPWDDPYQTGLHTEDSVLGLAEAGFVVLSPDYRGWGASEGKRGSETVDVAGALRALRAHPRVGGGGGAGGPMKVGLVGYSFGGGLALRAAEIDTGVSALALYYASIGGTYAEVKYHLATGDPSVSGAVREIVGEARGLGANDKEILYSFRMISPLFHVGRVAGPVLVLHGTADNTVPIRQSRALVAALEEAGKAVEFKPLDGLGHAFANSAENPTWGDLVGFLKRSLASS